MQWSPPGTCGGETVKRTPGFWWMFTARRCGKVWEYTGGGIGFSADRWLTGCPRRKAWMPRCCLRCASAMHGLMIWSVIMVLQQMRWRLHKDHIVGHLFLISYRPKLALSWYA
ncbi:phage portal protein, lambda family [Salmonella enterica subsp. arizonae]|nr:phage portal protein, lambda family [Salmonella enterica subsp. arizonae]